MCAMKAKADFSSALPYGRRGFAGAGPPGSDGGGEVKDNERTIEEGDIVKHYDNTLFVLNQYRGLQLIDVADRNSPSLLSTVPVYGYPVELYVRNGTAYVVISSYFNCWYNSVKAAAESFQGSRIVAVDVRDRRAPQITGAVDIDGSITDTRLVGSILYAVASQYSYYYDTTPEGGNRTSIAAVSIADPAQLTVVDQLSFPMTSSSYQNSVHVTPDSIFLAQYGWGYVDANGSWVEKNATDITCIDISDAAGAIRRGATFTVPGVVMNRWQMDYYNGYFRAITPEQYWGNGYPSLYIYKVDGLETITPVSSLTLKIDRPEALMSVRFDGAAAYAVTYERKDPLFTIDLTDPAQPRQLAEIQMSGWIDYLEPKPGHLVALGHDDVNGMTTLAVSLFDVERIDSPPHGAAGNGGGRSARLPTEYPCDSSVRIFASGVSLGACHHIGAPAPRATHAHRAIICPEIFSALSLSSCQFPPAVFFRPCSNRITCVFFSFFLRFFYLFPFLPYRPSS